MRTYASLEELTQQLETFENWQEVTKYEVVEYFGDKAEKRFNFLNLKAEVEDNTIFFYDAEETIYDTNSVLLGVLETSIQSMYYSVPTDNICEIRIILTDGYVDIIAHTHCDIPELEYASLDFNSPEVEKMYKEYYAEPDAYDL